MYFNSINRLLRLGKDIKSFTFKYIKPNSCQNCILQRHSVITHSKRNVSSFNNFWKKTSKQRDFGTYDIVKPGEISPGRIVPEHIVCPSYSNSMQPAPPPKEPEIHNESQIQSMKQSCQLARSILVQVSKVLKIGMTTDTIDELVHCLTIENGAYPSPLNYMGFPKSVCTSVNNVACHGIPDDRPLLDGDIVNVDVTVYYNGYHGDCSSTYLIGNVDEKGRELVETTRLCLKEAISICKDGEYFCNIGHVIETVSRRQGFSVLPAFAGHGISSYFHGPPDIFHCYNNYPGRMKEGMIFTIEPVLSQGDKEIVVLEDGWTAVTLDNARTAQFEHTLLITKRGAEILTGPSW